MSRRPDWLISRSGAISPPTGSTSHSVYLVRVERGTSKRAVVVEFADSSAVVSNGYAEEVTRRYLSDDEPPQHLVVELSGDVRIELGPLEPVDDVEGDPPRPAARPEPSPRLVRPLAGRPGTIGVAAVPFEAATVPPQA
jgi:hypothetical protein